VAYDKAKELEGENGGPALFCGAILGRALFEDGQPKEAQPYLERAIAAMYPVTDTTRPIVVDALYHLGRVHLALDDAKEGRRMLAACLEVLQSHEEAEVGLRVAVAHWHAYAWYKLEDFAEARKGFERAIELVEENEGKDALELTGHIAPPGGGLRQARRPRRRPGARPPSRLLVRSAHE
jgi:tetratricopeptide (TPR) repeat protein